MVWWGSDCQHIFTQIHYVKKIVKFDSDEEDAFKIHLPKNIVKFKNSTNGLYYVFPAKHQIRLKWFGENSEKKSNELNNQAILESEKSAQIIPHHWNTNSITLQGGINNECNW